MLSKITGDIANTDLWQKNGKKYIFSIGSDVSYTANDVVWLMSYFNIQCEKENEETISFSNPRILNRLSDFLKEKVKINAFLQGRYAKYNDMTDSDWYRLSRHMALFNGEKISYSRINEFIGLLKKEEKSNVYLSRVLREFIDIFNKRNLNGNDIKHKLLIDISPEIYEKHSKEDCTGVSCPQNDIIEISVENGRLDSSHIKIFVHELCHVNQYHNNLWSQHSQNEKDLIEIVAIESETYMRDILAEPNKYPFVGLILDNFKRKTLRDIFENRLTVPVNRNEHPAQKSAALNRFVEAVTNEKAVQLLIDCSLAKSRLTIYRHLKNSGIEMPPFEFYHLCSEIDFWKNFYVKDFYKRYDYNLYLDMNETDVRQYEQQWQLCSGLNFDLRPKQLISREIAAAVGIESDIYDDMQIPQKFITYHYPIVSRALINKTEVLIKQNDTQNIQRLYEFVRKQNTFLPHSDIVWNDTKKPEKRVLKALKTMSYGCSPIKVLNALGYRMQDEFEIKLAKLIARKRDNRMFRQSTRDSKERTVV